MKGEIFHEEDVFLAALDPWFAAEPLNGATRPQHLENRCAMKLSKQGS